MSKGMLGKLPLSAVRGPRDTLDELLAGSDGPIVLDELKKFNRRQTCWLPKERKGSKKKAKPAELVAPDGGRIHVLRVPVNPTREWQEAINAAGPNTPSNYDVRKVADKYPPQDGGVEEKKNYPRHLGKNNPRPSRCSRGGQTPRVAPRQPAASVRHRRAQAATPPRTWRKRNGGCIARGVFFRWPPAGVPRLVERRRSRLRSRLVRQRVGCLLLVCFRPRVALKTLVTLYQCLK